MSSGSGDGYFGKIDPIDQAQKIRDLEKQAQDSKYETKINEYLASELVNYNDRDVEMIQSILDTIKGDLKDQAEETIDLLFGGSISKHTFVDGLSDVDTLVIFNRTDLADKKPDELRNLLAQILKERYGKDKVLAGKLAVTANVKGHDIQLLPALKIGDAFKISSSGGKTWSRVHPQKFAEELTSVNQSQSGKVVPTIKLAKAIISKLPEQQQISGYHVESLAVKIFRNYKGPMTPKSMLTHFFEQSSSTVKTPIRDKTGQSAYIYEYLGPKNSTQRRIVSMAIDRISRRIRNADGMKSLEQWNQIIGEG